MEALAIAKFKIHQYVLMTDLPNFSACQSFSLYGIVHWIYMYNVHVYQPDSSHQCQSTAYTHDGRVWFGQGLRPHQSIWTCTIPTSKKFQYWRLVGPTCVKICWENTALCFFPHFRSQVCFKTKMIYWLNSDSSSRMPPLSKWSIPSALLPARNQLSAPTPLRVPSLLTAERHHRVA